MSCWFVGWLFGACISTRHDKYSTAHDITTWNKEIMDGNRKQMVEWNSRNRVEGKKTVCNSIAREQLASGGVERRESDNGGWITLKSNNEVDFRGSLHKQKMVNRMDRTHSSASMIDRREQHSFWKFLEASGRFQWERAWSNSLNLNVFWSEQVYELC